MMKRAALIGVLISLALPSAYSQDSHSPSHQLTSPVPGARYEVVQSPLAARWTFRLDRYTGKVWQLVKTKDDDNTWESMPVIGLSAPPNPSKARFQIFSSGLAARHTFLFDAETGRTWIVVTGKRNRPDGSEYEFVLWEPFAAP